MWRRRSASIVGAAFLVQAALAAEPSAAPPVVHCSAAATRGQIFSFDLGGNRAGFHTEFRMADGSGENLFEFKDGVPLDPVAMWRELGILPLDN